jgi:hypothetical protein
VKCPECGKSVVSEHGLRTHIGAAHSGKPKKASAFACGICGGGYASLKSLDAHGYNVHKPQGRVRQEWMNRQQQRSVAPAPQPLEAVPEPAVALAESSHGESPFPTRVFPPKEDRNNAETLAGLPWLTFPTTVEQCDDALIGIAIGLERTQIASPFWLSLRTYVTALRKRLEHKVAA